jgi:hypothetical protein
MIQEKNFIDCLTSDHLLSELLQWKNGLAEVDLTLRNRIPESRQYVLFWYIEYFKLKLHEEL